MNIERMRTNRADALIALREHCIAAADDRYIVPGEHYDRRDAPLAGLCAPVAYAVMRRFGGRMVAAWLRRGVMIESHVWNILPDGTEIDLTSDQFGGDGFNPIQAVRRAGTSARLGAIGLPLARSFDAAIRELEAADAKKE